MLQKSRNAGWTKNLKKWCPIQASHQRKPHMVGWWFWRDWEINVTVNFEGVHFQFSRCISFPLKCTSREYFRWWLLGWLHCWNGFHWLLSKLWMSTVFYISKNPSQHGKLLGRWRWKSQGPLEQIHHLISWQASKVYMFQCLMTHTQRIL